jgi:hypothetical protein
MNKKFLGHISNLDYGHIKRELNKITEFSDLSSWKIKKLNIGEMEHTYLFSKGDKKYFVKEVKPHEAQVNYFLCSLKLNHLPYSIHPELLKKRILVMPYLKGKMLRKRKIDYNLLGDFIKFQNKMHNRIFFSKNNIMNLKNYSNKDEGFCIKNFNRDWNVGYKNIINLKKIYNLDIISKFIEIIDKINSERDKIIKEFSQMPFARQHHDFREDNILVTKKGQMLIDWGSSYGYGSFMYDYADFLINDRKALNLVVNESIFCKKVSKEKVKRWLYVSLIKKMFNMLCWYIPKGHHNIATKKRAKKMLEYEYKTYKVLK